MPEDVFVPRDVLADALKSQGKTYVGQARSALKRKGYEPATLEYAADKLNRARFAFVTGEEVSRFDGNEVKLSNV